MANLIDDFLSGLASSSGKSIGEGCENIATGAKAILNPFSKSKSRKSEGDMDLNDEIMNYFKENIRNIEIETMSETTEYNDIDENHPQRCYIAKVLPQAINDLFQGKTIFVQPFKK